MNIKKDFDNIASLVQKENWNHNNHYHDFILNFVPNKCDSALDIGCGTGDFIKLLSPKCNHVMGIELSENMIEASKMNLKGQSNVCLKCQDILSVDFNENSFDFIVSIATFHHIPYETILKKCKKWLSPKGTLVILDLYKEKSVVDYVYSIVSSPLNIVYKIYKNKRIREHSKVKAMWQEHIAYDEYMTVQEIHEVAAKILPDSNIKRHLFWRYSLIWNKGGTM